MSTHKTTGELDRLLGQLQADIAAAEASVGRMLFGSGSEEAGTQLRDEFLMLEGQKEGLRRDTDEIRSLGGIRTQLQAESDSIRKQGSELSAGWAALHEKLGSALADSPDAAYGRELEPFRQQLAEFRRKDAEARDALEALRSQMEGQSFMNRLLTQVQYSARSTASGQLRRKLSHLYARCGKDVLASGVLPRLYESGSLTADVAAAYALCADLQRRIDANSAELADCASRLDDNERQLIGKGVTGSVERRVGAIEREIRQKTERQEAVCRTAGHDFSLKYIDPDGEELVSRSGMDGDLSEALDRIADLRRQAVVCRRKLQILSLSEKIDSASRRLEGLRRSIRDNEEKIARLSAQNEELRSGISSVEAEREQLVARRGELELADAAATKRIPV